MKKILLEIVVIYSRKDFIIWKIGLVNKKFRRFWGISIAYINIPNFKFWEKIKNCCNIFI